MFRKLTKNKKAQNTAEYALLIALVVAAVIAMQTYAQRALQSRIRDTSKFLTDATGSMGNTQQYEPYYLDQSYEVGRDSRQWVDMRGGKEKENRTSGWGDLTNRTRAAGGYQESDYRREAGETDADLYQ
ncbi:MAG: hypothetical protein GY861_23890 [bacterium]|nr:hypothetical protein [bacterium]